MVTRRAMFTALAALLPVVAVKTTSAQVAMPGSNCPVCGQPAKGPNLPLVTAAPMDDFAPMRHVWAPVWVCSNRQCGTVFVRDTPSMPYQGKGYAR